MYKSALFRFSDFFQRKQKEFNFWKKDWKNKCMGTIEVVCDFFVSQTFCKKRLFLNKWKNLMRGVKNQGFIGEKWKVVCELVHECYIDEWCFFWKNFLWARTRQNPSKTMWGVKNQETKIFNRKFDNAVCEVNYIDEWCRFFPKYCVLAKSNFQSVGFPTKFLNSPQLWDFLRLKILLSITFQEEK